MSEVKRPYRSPRRREQAEETRRRILDAARRGFVKRGYGGTTMESLADAAGVSVQTIYASLGSKQGILMALLDDMSADADLPGMMAAVEAAKGNPRKQLRERLAFTSRLYARGADLIDIARTVSGVEPDLRAFWLEGEARRHRGTATLVAEWGAAGALAPGVTAKQATDVMWALGGPDVFRLFVAERGWSQAPFEEWLAATLEMALFGPAATP
jgi:AcrR family transcriptional regulator